MGRSPGRGPQDAWAGVREGVRRTRGEGAQAWRRLALGGTVGAAPAVIGAVLDALEPLGVTDIDMPATPERIWRAIHMNDS